MISPKENQDPIVVYSEKEIKKVVFQLVSLGSPGLIDSYPTKFYQHMWDSIGSDFKALLQNFFKNKYSIRKLSKTFIVYYPKKSSPENVNCFRPH